MCRRNLFNIFSAAEVAAITLLTLAGEFALFTDSNYVCLFCCLLILHNNAAKLLIVTGPPRISRYRHRDFSAGRGRNIRLSPKRRFRFLFVLPPFFRPEYLQNVKMF